MTKVTSVISHTENESFSEQVERVKSMARGDGTWDLSDNDQAALKAILAKLEEQGISN